MAKLERISNYKIYETNNYKKFKKLLGNREVTQQRVSNIKDSILRIGYQPSPIIVNEKYEVIDGQGRLSALEELNIPVLYIKVDGLGVDDCISMNIKMKNWSRADYIKSYAERGNENFQRLQKAMTMFPSIPLRAVLVAINGTDITGSSEIQNGKLIVGELTPSAISSLHWLSACACATKVNLTMSEMMTLARLNYYGLINPDRMLEQLTKYGESRLNHGRSVEHIVANFNELYNFNRAKRTYFTDAYRTLISHQNRGKRGNKNGK